MIRAIAAPSRVHVVVNSQSKHAMRIADSVDIVKPKLFGK